MSDQLIPSVYNQLDSTSTLKRPMDNEYYETSGTPPAKRSIAMGDSGSYGVVVETIHVPEDAVGLVIGRGGTEIQSIQAMSGCRVQMGADHVSNNGMRSCTLQGDKTAVDKARQLISDVVMRAAQRQQHATGDASNSSNAITIEMTIPANKCGLVIGRSGETIRMLQEKSGCKMQLIQDSNQATGQPKQLRLVGDSERLALAKRLVDEILMSEAGPVYEGRMSTEQLPAAKGELIVPRSSVGMIIGKGGETIRRLASETGTKIQFKPDEDPSAAERCAVISGSREQIYKATERITELVNKSLSNEMAATQEQQVFYMHIPATKTGLVIGKGGETIKQINSQSGAHCELSKEPPPNEQEKVFVLKGTAQQIQHAQHIIRIKVGDIPPNTQYMGSGGGAQMAGGQPGLYQSMQYPGYPIQAQQAYYGSTDWGQQQQQHSQPQHQQQQGGGGQMPGGYQQAGLVYQASTGGQPTPMATPQSYMTAGAATAAAVPGGVQPSINPSTGQLDYSAHWAKYYREVGLYDQAAMVENQIKQNQVARSQQLQQLAGKPQQYGQYQAQ